VAYKERHHRNVDRISMVFFYVYLFLKYKQISKGIEFVTFKTWLMNLLWNTLNLSNSMGLKLDYML